jgi:hypothetical protein
MAFWLNQSDIEGMAERRHACPNVRKGVKLLYVLMQAVNDQSDGWPYWSAPSRAAARLMELLDDRANPFRGPSRTMTEQELKAAVTPIRRMVTVQTKKQKRFGNTFEFDVDAALREGVPV